MFHELRTPLNIASGALQTATMNERTLEDSEDVETFYIIEGKYFHMIKKANYNLTGLINNLIIYSDLDENLLINHEFFNMEPVVKECADFFKPWIEPNVNFSYHLHQFNQNILI